MNKLSYKKEFNILAFVAVFISLVFNLNTLFTTSRFTSAQYAVVSLIVYVLLFAANAIKNHGIISFYNVPFFVLLLISVSLTALINFDLNILYLVIMLELLKAMLLLSMVSYEELIEYYILSIYILAVYSLILHLLFTLIPGISSIGRSVYNSNGHAFKDFIFYYRDSTESFRNFGFLSEPGDYQHYLNIGLILNLFFTDEQNSRRNNKVSIVLSLATVTTFSPAGILFLLCIWIAYYLNNIKDLKKFISLVVAAFIFIVLVMHVGQINSGVNYAINKLSTTDSGSFKVRWIGIVAGLQAFLKNPIVGMGYSNGTAYMTNIFSKNGLGYNQTSTVTGLLGFFGIPFTLCTLLAFFKFFKLPRKCTVASKILIFIGLFLSINNERLIWELTFYIFVIFGACYGGKENNNLVYEEESYINN